MTTLSLRQRLLLRVALVLALSLVIGTFSAYWRAASKVRTELHSAFTVAEQMLLDAVKEIERSPNPYQQLRIVIERFSGGRHLKVTLLDNSGDRIAQSRLDLPDDPAPDWFLHWIGGDPETSTIKLPKNVGNYASFLVEADARNEVQELWEDLGNVLLTLTVLGIIVSTLIYWSVGRELKTLEDLSHALARIANRDFSSRLAEVGPRDLRAVAHGFNQMAVGLDQAEASKAILEEQLSNVQEEERAELARDLHDEIGPLLFSVALDAAAVQKQLGDSVNRDVVERLDSIREAVGLSQKHVLEILGRLRSGSVEDLGLEGAIERLKIFWMTRHPNLLITASVPEHGVSMKLDPVVYRIVQEGLSNAIRHGQPKTIDIAITGDTLTGARVSVTDDGGGMKSNRQGNGLIGMRERVVGQGGQLSVGNRPDNMGVAVVAVFPPAGTTATIENRLESVRAAP